MENKDDSKDLVPVTEEQPLQLPKPVLTEHYKKLMLSNAVFHLTEQEKFYGGLLQEITIKYNEFVPTAGITYNKKHAQYEMVVNPYFFDSVKPEERVAVFQHEILHFTNKHLFRFPFLKDSTSEDDRRLYNIAGDMAINQYIQNLPAGCVDYKQWKTDGGDVFPPLKTMEQYFELIKEEIKQQQESKEKQDQGKDPGKTSDGKDRGQGNILDKMTSYKPFDQHDWDALDEETKKKMLDEAKKLIKRTIEKTSNGYTKTPDEIQDLLVEIDSLAAGLNYKAILKAIIKKTVSCIDRESTWKKPNRRYGIVSPGSKVGCLPALSFYLDTSGSISLKELNMFLDIMSNFLKVGTRDCWLGLWHTALYYKRKYKLREKLKENDLQSGGTDVGPALEDIKKTSPNLAIILTDGYYDVHDIKIHSEVLFIISEGGNKEHPLKHIGKTIRIEDLK